MILIVDDSMVMRRIIKNTLIRLGIQEKEILEAEDGIEAYEKYIQNKDNIDTILTDWNMPNMNGLELVNKIRKDNKNVKIVMITTEGGKKEVITALKAGVNNYIVKPFTPQVLKEKLQQIGIA